MTEKKRNGLGCLEQTEADGQCDEADGSKNGRGEVAGSAAASAAAVAVVVIGIGAIAVAVVVVVVVAVTIAIAIAITITIAVTVAVSRAIVVIIIVITTATIAVTAATAAATVTVTVTITVTVAVTATVVVIIVVATIVAATAAVAVGLVGLNRLLRLNTSDAGNTAAVAELVDILLGATQIGLGNADLIVSLVIDDIGRAQEGIAEENEAAVPDAKPGGSSDAEHADLVEVAEVATVSSVLLQCLLFQIGKGVDDHLPHGDSDDLAVELKIKRVVLASVAGP